MCYYFQEDRRKAAMIFDVLHASRGDKLPHVFFTYSVHKTNVTTELVKMKGEEW